MLDYLDEKGFGNVSTVTTAEEGHSVLAAKRASQGAKKRRARHFKQKALINAPKRFLENYQADLPADPSCVAA